MLFKMDLKGWDEVQELKTKLPKKLKSTLNKVGEIFLEELEISASKLSRAAQHGFVKRVRDHYFLPTSFSKHKFTEDFLSIASDVPYASILETGGNIVASDEEKLTVPLPGISMSQNMLHALRERKRTFVSRSGKAIMLRLAKREVMPIFALKEKVHIRKTGYITKAEYKATPRIEKMIYAIMGNT